MCVYVLIHSMTFSDLRQDLISVQNKLHCSIWAKTLQLIGPRQELEVGCVATQREKSSTKTTHMQGCARQMQRPRAVQTAATVDKVNVDKHIHIWPVNATKWAPCQTKARRQIVYTNGGRKSAQQGPNGRLALEWGHLRSWRVVVVMWSWQAADAEGGCVGGSAPANWW